MSIGRRFWVGATLLFALVGCSSGRYGGAEDASVASENAKAVTGSVAADAPQVAQSGAVAANLKESAGSAAVQPRTVSMVTQRSIIRKAELSVRVESVEKAEKAVDKMVNGFGGYVDSAESTDLASDKPSITLTLRVPVGSFDTALDQFEKLGVRLAKTISSEDVTGQLVDLDARLKTLSATEETYRGLLRDTHQLEHVIELQDKLTEVRSQIESMAAQRKALGGLAALSTIALRLEQSAVPAQAPRDPNWLAQTWGESTSRLGEMLRSLASVGIWLAVFSPIWLPLLWLGRKSYVAAKAAAVSTPVPPAPPIPPVQGR